MKPEDRILLLCSRQMFTDEHKKRVIDICQESNIDWPYVFLVARQDGVVPLIFRNFSRIPSDNLNISPEELKTFMLYQLRCISTRKAMDTHLREVISYFDQKDIDVMLIKGEAINLIVYKEPWLTLSADIDLILRPRNKERLDEDEILGINHFIHAYNRRDTFFKQHIEFDFYEHHDVTMNKIIPIDFQRIWNDAITTTAFGSNIFIMTPEDTLMALAINSCRKRFFRLKSLCDIAEVIQAYPRMNWGEIALNAKEYQCNNILFAALYVTQSTIGCSLPDKSLTDLGVNPIRSTVICGLVKTLLRYSSLFALSLSSEKISKTQVKKGPSLSLLVTYATYSWKQILKKFNQIIFG